MQKFRYKALPIDVHFGIGGKSAGTKGIDCWLALGGGSTSKLAKIVALQVHLPIVAIPTTYAERRPF